MVPRAFVPAGLVGYFLLLDFLLAGAYLGTTWWGHLNEIFDMSKENNIPTWYSALQYAVSALLFGLYARLNVTRNDPRSWVLICLPVLCLMMSLDEDASLHERLGPLLDRVLLDSTREASVLPRTGAWFLIGIPFLMAVYFGMRSIHRYFAAVPRAYIGCCGGFTLIVFAAAGLEAVSNFIGVLNTSAYFLETLAEESLEMLGSTLILWGAVELLNSIGLRIEASDSPVSFRQAANDGGYKSDEIRGRS
jgi:hypothetical protein